MIDENEILLENRGKLYVEQTLSAYRYFKDQGSKIWGDPTVVYEFLSEHGKAYQGTRWTKFRGTGYHKMKIRHCFANTWKACSWNDELKYCEGFACAGVIPVHHAWAIDPEGRVVDFTWRESVQSNLPPEEWDYFGITFDLDKLARILRGKDTWSILFDLPYADEDVSRYVIS